MDKELLKEYAELKIAEKRNKERLAELMPLIKKDLVDQGVDKLPTSYGNFLLKKVKRWTYSGAVKVAEETVEKLMEAEKADGTATFVEAEQLEFREIKPEQQDAA